MKASDVMASPVITVKPQDTVKHVAELFLRRGISAAPVVDDAGKLVGIISEADLLRRVETDSERQRPRWLRHFVGSAQLATEYVKSHAMKVADLMTRAVVTATPGTPLHELATLMERSGIKRVPIVSDGQIVGIVSRANFVQAIAGAGTRLEVPLSDTEIRDRLLAHLKGQGWADSALINPTVRDGVVNLWGIVDSASQRTALRIAAEALPGVRAVNDHLVPRPVG